jgi:hypothetical protein
MGRGRLLDSVLQKISIQSLKKGNENQPEHFNNNILGASFEGFTSMIVQTVVFLIVISHSLVGGYQRYRGTCLLHLQSCRVKHILFSSINTLLSP